MEQNRIHPVPVDAQEPTCLAALSVMAAHLGVSSTQVRLALKMACIPLERPAAEWADVLPRALSLLEHPVRGYDHAL